MPGPEDFSGPITCSAGISRGRDESPDSGFTVAIVTATIDRSVRRLDVGVLKWGNEKILSVDIQRVGAHSQRFTIRVQP